MSEHLHMTMDRNIFNLKLSVEATSAYIIVTAVTGESVRPSLEVIRAKWNKEDHDLDAALNELMDRGVLQHRTGPDGKDLYYPNPSSLWR
jgi:hypothetical protein